MNDDRLAALLAERYAKPTWWKTPEPEAPADDDPVTTARRRRHLADAYARHDNYHRKEGAA